MKLPTVKHSSYLFCNQGLTAGQPMYFVYIVTSRNNQRFTYSGTREIYWSTYISTLEPRTSCI